MSCNVWCDYSTYTKRRKGRRNGEYNRTTYTVRAIWAYVSTHPTPVVPFVPSQLPVARDFAARLTDGKLTRSEIFWLGLCFLHTFFTILSGYYAVQRFIAVFECAVSKEETTQVSRVRTWLDGMVFLTPCILVSISPQISPNIASMSTQNNSVVWWPWYW